MSAIIPRWKGRLTTCSHCWKRWRGDETLLFCAVKVEMLPKGRCIVKLSRLLRKSFLLAVAAGCMVRAIAKFIGREAPVASVDADNWVKRLSRLIALRISDVIVSVVPPQELKRKLFLHAHCCLLKVVDERRDQKVIEGKRIERQPKRKGFLDNSSLKRQWHWNDA